MLMTIRDGETGRSSTICGGHRRIEQVFIFVSSVVGITLIVIHVIQLKMIKKKSPVNTA